MTRLTASGPVCTVCEIHAESVFKIDGLDCRDEVVILERRLKRLPGLEDLSADVMAQRLRVKYDAAKLSTEKLIAAVAETGMRAWLEHEDAAALPSTDAVARQVFVIVSAVLLAVGLALSVVAVPWWLSAAFYGGSIVSGGLYTLRRAWWAARSGSFDINVLMLVAVTGAIAIGDWAEGATVIFLFAMAQLLEARSMDRARHAIRSLMELSPAQARVRGPDGEALVSIDAVTVGAEMLVGPGEKIPLDGVVVAGFSAVNQAPITGESLPIDKQPGDEVFAGTINGHGALDISVTRLRRDTTLARIIHLVETAQAQRAPTQAFVERFARYYTPVVIALAVLLATIAPVALHEPFSVWFYRALVLLVISCPCALVISTPVSIVSALAGAARKGVLIKGGIHLERAGRVRCMAFDKTGTLTKGTPEVADVLALNGVGPNEILALAASLEARSEHPIGRAILKHATAVGVRVETGDGFLSLPGRGAEATVQGRHIVVGNHRLFEERGLCTPDLHAQIEAVAGSGQTAVAVASQGAPVGLIVVADRAREAGRDAIDLLRHQGVEHLVMLTGDNRATASALADAMGLDESRAELLPEDKVAAVEDLRRRYGCVAMVGDGINDAPALAAADIGIAMGVAGADAALETADVALMADELLKIPYALRLSRRTLRNIKTNVAISIVMKAAFLALAIAGVATLWMAVVADTGTSVIVIANGLRLLRAD